MNGAQEWLLTYDVIIDAQTGRLIEKMRAELSEKVAPDAAEKTDE